MKEKPIIFSDEMVRAILDGSKHQIRRAIKSPVSDHDHLVNGYAFVHDPMILYQGSWFKPNEWSPFGQRGDRLWVKETWKIDSFMENEAMKFQYRADGAIQEETNPIDYPAYEGWHERNWEKFTQYLMKIKWPMDEDGIYYWDFGKSPLPWQSPIFMPRWASRITLEIIDVWVERVQQINWVWVIEFKKIDGNEEK